MSEPRCRLYLIAPTPLPAGFTSMLEEALQGGDVAALRVDVGALDDAAGLAALAAVRVVAHARGVAVIVVNRVGLAAGSGCDGAHLDGLATLSARDARKLLGDLQLGVWCGGSRDLAMQAGEDGADYVAFGPFFGAPDAPREPPGSPAGEEDEAVEDKASLLRWWVELMELPAVAEGGITVGNCAELVQAGADFLAVGEAVWQHGSGPGDAVRAFNQAIREHAAEV